MNEAIKLAIAQGWTTKCCLNVEKNWRWYKPEITQDPLFWQALGKALEWKHGFVNIHYEGMVKDEEGNTDDSISHVDQRPFWAYKMIQFMDIKLTGGDEDKFWKDLIPLAVSSK